MDIPKDFYDRIADLCLEHFDNLPKSGKPNPTEWTVLSCIVLESRSQLRVIASGTGSKCIGKMKMSDTGDILNDSHAEVICRRSFLRFIYHQMMITDSSVVDYHKNTNKFALSCGVKFHFFTTQVPCGDAAIFPKQKSVDIGDMVEDFTDGVPCKKTRNDDVFRTGAKCLEDSQLHDLKLPGSGYHILGAVRTKPGRGDPTLSVSCSDKLTRWCHMGIQGALLSLLLVKPIYLSSFIITADTPFSKKSLERALHGRIGYVALDPPYFQNKMNIFQCSKKFGISKTDGKRASPSSMSWCDTSNKSFEVAVDGKRQGITKKKANTEMARLRICKLELFKTFLGVCETRNIILRKHCDNSSLTYECVKNLAEEYQMSWHVLRKTFKTWSCKDKSLIKFSIE